MEFYYFILKERVKHGPYKLAELKQQTIYFDELIWRSDDDKWIRAADLEELKDVFIVKPPPTPKEIGSKKTVNLSEQLLASVLIGFLLASIVVIVGHLSPQSWKAMPGETSSYGTYSYGSRVSWCSYECMFGAIHSSNCQGMKLSEVGQKGLTGEEIFSASLEHMSTILIIGLIASAVIYIFKRVSFQVVKE
ncbi:MAG: hypothetical protein JWP69_2276 [Flaviaesturariibacter sp.]|nr:hypothetical protein [Flaviaesturariibacter sp.]